MGFQKKNTGWLLGGLSLCACTAAALLAVRNCEPQECLVFGCAMLAVFVLGSLCLRRHIFAESDKVTLWAAVVLLFLGLCARLIVFPNVSGDYEGFLSLWLDDFRSMGVRRAICTPVGDYNMPYLYFMILLTRLPVSSLYGLKLFSCAADVALALGLAKLTMHLTKNTLRTLLVFCATLMVPTVLLNSAYWAQCDAIYTALLVWGLYACITDRPVRGMALFALALSFKLQAIFTLPVLVFFLQQDRIRWRHIPTFPLVFALTLVPALLFGRSFYDTVSIYFEQVQEYPALSMNAPSFWSLYPVDAFSRLGGAALLLSACVVMLLMFLLLTAGDRRRMTEEELFTLALIFALVIPWILPKMHERYFYTAETLVIVYAALHPKRSWMAVVLLLGGMRAYNAYLFGMNGSNILPIFAVCYGGIAAVLTSNLYRAMMKEENALKKE